MTTTQPRETPPPSPARTVDKAQFGLAVVLAVLGGYTIYDASTLRVGFADPVGPRVFPYVIGSALVVLAILLFLATLRGDVGQPEDSEDVDLGQRPDMMTVLKLVSILVFNIATIDLLGWAITGAVLFVGCSWALGSRTLIRDIVIGTALSVGSWYFFYVVLDIPLSPGILDGIL